MQEIQMPQIWNSILRKKSKKIQNFQDSSLLQMIEDLTNIMRNESLVGISAVQIWHPIRVFLTEIRVTKYRSAKDSDPLRIIINPEILWQSKKTIIFYEWCGSVIYSDLFGPVRRSECVEIRYQDIDWDLQLLKCDWLLARVILHEYDHLEWILFTDKISDYTKIMSWSEYSKYKDKKVKK